MLVRLCKLTALVVLTLLFGAVLAGCSQEERDKRSNVKPPTPGTPATGADITGIYRSFNLAVLQFRADGTYTLIVRDSKPSAGQFTLTSGQLEVQSDVCGAAVGRYSLVVTGEKEAGKAKLEITPTADDCTRRKVDLGAGPWVYANS